MNRRAPLAAAIAGLLLLAGCATQPEPTPEPTPTPSVTATVEPPAPAAPVDVETVDPAKVVEELPSNPDAYDTSAGAKKPPTKVVPDTAPLPAPSAAQEQQIVIPPQDGFGAAPLTYAKIGGSNKPRFDAQQAVAIAVNEAKHPSGINWRNKCEGFAGAYSWGWVSSGWYSANDAALGLPRNKVTSFSQRFALGSLVYYIGGFGHAMILVGYNSAGQMMVASTDILRQGKVDVVPLELVADRWFGGRLPYSIVEPVKFPRSFGNNGLKIPVPEAVPAIFPIKVGESDKRIVRLKAHYNWSNRLPAFGDKFAKKLIKQGVTGNRKISFAEWLRVKAVL